MTKETLEKVKAIRKAQNKASSSTVIQAWQSDLYDYNPGVRATLIAIAFLQMNDEDSNYPEDAPKALRDDRVGWCWASQKFLAARVGKSERQVRRDIARFQRDGVIEVRQWRDSNKALHDEYHVLEDVVQAHQRPEDKDATRPKRSSRDYSAYENKGAFRKGDDPRRGGLKNHSDSTQNSEDHRTSDAGPEDISRRDHRTSHEEAQDISRCTIGHLTQEPLREMSHKGVDPVRLPGGFVSPLLQADHHLVPAAPELGAAPPVIEKKIEPSKGSWADQNRPEGKVTKGERKPLPNRLCYPELYAQWQKRRGKIPSCKRCKEILFWEEHHDCPGFREHEYGPILGPVAPKGTEVFEDKPRKRAYQTFDDMDEPEEDDLSGYEDPPEEDDLSGYEDFDDDHLPRAAAREDP